MLRSGILNPQIRSLLGRVRHTNTIVIADRGFPFFREIETIDISLIDDVPRVLEVLTAIRENFVCGRAWMAEEFWKVNEVSTATDFERALAGVTLEAEPHELFKQRVPRSVGLIRTGETIQYANIILESA